MWRFKFCKQEDGSSCNTENWNGGLLFQSSSGFIQPIFTTATVARDSSSLWVLWGTGDKENPNATNGIYHFFALKDNDRTTPYTISNFQDISNQGTIFSGAQAGWYITLSETGEKLLSDPTVFGGIVLFTTYAPTLGSDPCSKVGTGKLYAMAMMRLAFGGYIYDTGAGVLSTPSSPSVTTGGAKSITLGSGIAKSPIISQKPSGGSTDLFISLSGGAGKDTQIISTPQLANLGPTAGSMPLIDRLKTTARSNQVIHWKDGRIQ